MHLSMEDASSIMPNGDPTLIHVKVTHTLSKWDETDLFEKVRSRGTTFMLNTFSLEALIMMNFEVEV